MLWRGDVKMARETAALATVRVARVAKMSMLVCFFILDSLVSLSLVTADNGDARESDDGAMMAVGENAAPPTTNVVRGIRLIFFMLVLLLEERAGEEDKILMI